MLFLSIFLTCALAQIINITLPPVEDPFYDAPSNLSDLTLGEVYDSRQVTTEKEILEIAGLLGETPEVYQIAYRTSNALGNASHSVATVFIPKIPASENKLFSYQMHENAVGANCAPSYSLVKGTKAPSYYDTYDAGILVSLGLAEGYYVVVADDEGPNSGFFAGFENGYIGLDGIRAALNFLQFDKDTPTALYGYSGASIATAWMAELQGSYAPEINIVGAAHGGTPVDPQSMINSILAKKPQYIGYIFAAISGILSAYPEQNATIWPQLCDTLKTDLLEAHAPNACSSEMLILFENQTITNSCLDTSKIPGAQHLIDINSLLNNVSTLPIPVPKFPRYMWHAKNDDTVPIQPAIEYVEQQCAGGANIQFVEWALGGHISTGLLGIPDSFRFIVDSFDGDTANVQCGTASSTAWYLGPGSAEIYDIIEDIAEGTETIFDDIYSIGKDIVDAFDDLLFGNETTSLKAKQKSYVEGKVPNC